MCKLVFGQGWPRLACFIENEEELSDWLLLRNFTRSSCLLRKSRSPNEFTQLSRRKQRGSDAVC